MSALRAFIFAAAALLVINYVSASFGHGGCPPKNKVYNNKPTCFSDADCQKYGKVCCPNQFNTKTCVDRAPWNSVQDDRNNKYTDVCGTECKVPQTSVKRRGSYDQMVKSCVDRAPWNSVQDDRNNKYSGGGGGGVYCEGVKCMPYEVCKPDPITKRMKCQRA